MQSTVTSKGQVTIPKAIRAFLKIAPNDKVDFSVENGQVILKPLKTLKDLRGCVPGKGKGDIKMERRLSKAKVGKRVMGEVE